MTLRWIEGFEIHDTKLDLYRKYQNFDSITPIMGSGFRFGESARGIHLRTVPFTARDTWVLGIELNHETAGFLTGSELGFYLGDQEQCHVDFTASGSGYVVRFLRGSTVVATASRVMTFDTWYYLEMRVTVHASAGAYEIRIDSEDILSDSAVNTANAGVAQADTFDFESGMWMDNIYILDDQGTVNNSFIGPQMIEGLFVIGDGDEQDWTPHPSTSAAWQTIDETTQASTSDYIASDTATDQATFDLEDLVYIEAMIAGITLLPITVSTCVGTRDIKGIFRSILGNIYDTDSDTLRAMTTRAFMQILERNPETNSRWVTSEINDSQFGVELE